MNMKFKNAAEQFFQAFEQRERDNGEAFYCLEDGAPEWMTEAIMQAHDAGERMPCDYIYNACHSAVCHICDACTGEDDDAGHEFADGFVTVYNAQRAAWLGDHLGNGEYVDDAMSEGLVSLEGGIYAAIGAGMYVQAIVIFSAIYQAIDEQAEEMPGLYVAGWNMPGCMPDMEPDEFDTLDDAKRYIIDELKSLEEQAGDDAQNAKDEGDPGEFERLESLAEEYCHAAEDVNLWSSPTGLIAGAFAFWIAENES